MTESELRNKIEYLEQEIRNCDDDIYWTNEKRKTAISEYERYDEKAANGGGAVFSADHMSGMADMHYSDAERFKQEIRELERRKEKLIYDLKKYQNMLAKAGNNNSGGTAYTPGSFSTSKRKNNDNTLKDKLLNWKISWTVIGPKWLMIQVMKIIIPYAFVIVAIMYVSEKMYLGWLAGLTVPFIGPIVFAVVVRKIYLNRFIPNKRVAFTNFLAYIMGVLITFPSIFHLSTTTIIVMIIFCLIAGIGMAKEVWNTLLFY